MSVVAEGASPPDPAPCCALLVFFFGETVFGPLEAGGRFLRVPSAPELDDVDGEVDADALAASPADDGDEKVAYPEESESEVVGAGPAEPRTDRVLRIEGGMKMKVIIMKMG